MAAPIDGVAGHDSEDDWFGQMTQINPDPPEKRAVCSTCLRPTVGCWCQYLVKPPMDIKTTLLILQHPFEEKRCLRTAPMLKHGLVEEKCHILKGKRFHPDRHKILKEVTESPNTLLLYPSLDSVDIKEIVSDESSQTSFNLILLDGTWAQAKGIFQQNKFLHKIKQVKLTDTGISEYVIRTQPEDGNLSTVETAALAISLLEDNPDLKEKLLRPLRALCSFQIEHGALVHHSKKYLLDHGIYFKQVPKSILRKNLKEHNQKLEEEKVNCSLEKHDNS